MMKTVVSMTSLYRTLYLLAYCTYKVLFVVVWRQGVEWHSGHGKGEHRPDVEVMFEDYSARRRQSAYRCAEESLGRSCSRTGAPDNFAESTCPRAGRLLC